MRSADLKRLSTPYSSDDARESELMAALNVRVPNWERLDSTILNDLTPKDPFGIGWWAPHPGTTRRILISDQLYACVVSTSSNMIEAGLHWLEFLDHSERERARFADAVQERDGRLTIDPPQPMSPIEEISAELERTHIAGLARSLSGALDCLSGAIVGVLALPTSILFADLSKVRKRLDKLGSVDTEVAQVQREFAKAFEKAVSSAGPIGWLDWTLAFRNMLVHRGRRIELGQYVPLYGANGHTVSRTYRVTHLPRDPNRSDVEVLRDPIQSSVLTEDRDQTLAGVLESTKRLIDCTAASLLEVWNWRRDNPELLPQPPQQWPNGCSNESLGFSGYAPGTYQISPNMGMTNPDVARRWRAAALDDPSRLLWNDFD